MAVEFKVLAKEPATLSENFSLASEIAMKFRACLEHDEVQYQFKERHVLGASSARIQEVVLKDALALGFQSEKKGLFRSYAVSQLRPDYYLPLRESGILLEVERGKAITNNMDLLDLWKCHICPAADFLFLVLPVERPSAKGSSIKAFHSACRRLAPFFEARNYVNVEAVFLYGY